MKHCPECNRNYADPTLGFCLQDGAPLLFGAAEGEPATAILRTGASEQATKILDNDPTTNEASFDGAAQSAFNRNSILAGVIGIILVTTLGIGSYFYYGRG